MARSGRALTEGKLAGNACALRSSNVTSSLWDETKSRDNNRVIIASAALAVASIALSAILPHIGVWGGTTAHVVHETISAVLATIIGITLIIISRSAEQPWMKTLGWGFVIAAGIGLFHGIVGSPAVADAIGNSKQISDWASVASRMTLAGFALWAALKLDKRSDSDSAKRSLWWPILIVVVLVVGSGLLSILQAPDNQPFIPAIRINIFPGLVFLTAFVIALDRQSPARYTVGAFSIFLLTNGAADAVFMVYAVEPFDPYFSATHNYKFFGFGIMLIGLLAETHRLHRFELTARQELGRVNESLNDSNLGLTSASNDLAALNRIGRISGASQSVTDRFDQIGEVIRSRIDADRIAVAVRGPSSTGCRIEAVFSRPDGEPAIGSDAPLTGTLFGNAILNQGIAILDESTITKATQNAPWLESDLNAGIKSWIFTPIIAEGKPNGILLVRSLKAGAYSSREAQFIEQVASQLAAPVSRDSAKMRVSPDSLLMTD